MEFDNASPDQIIAEIENLIDEENFNEAISICNQMIQSGPDEPAGYYARGFVHYSSGNYDQAVKDWSAAIDKVSEDNTELFKDLYFKRGSLYANMDEIEPAMKDFLRLIELDTAEGKYYQKLVVLYKEQSDYEYTRSIELDPNEDAYQSRAKLYLAKGREDLANIDYTKIEELRSQSDE